MKRLLRTRCRRHTGGGIVTQVLPRSLVFLQGGLWEGSEKGFRSSIGRLSLRGRDVTSFCCSGIALEFMCRGFRLGQLVRVIVEIGRFLLLVAQVGGEVRSSQSGRVLWRVSSGQETSVGGIRRFCFRVVGDGRMLLRVRLPKVLRK